MSSKSQDIINFIKSHKALTIVLCFICPPLLLVGLIVYVLSKSPNKNSATRQTNKQKSNVTQNKVVKNISSFVKNHKKFCLIILAIIVAITAIILGVKAIKTSVEENRDYYIAIDNEFTFDCNAHYDEKANMIYCDEQTISGTFSNFETAKLYFVDKIDGNSFSNKEHDYLYKSEYEKENFNISDLNNELKRTKSIYLKNTYLNKDMLRKDITIHYRLSEADKSLIKQKHNDWKAWKEAEDAKKAKQEDEAKEEAQTQEEKTKQKTSSRLPDDLVEQECQDAKYYIQSSYYNKNVKDVISISNYNFGVYEDAYDKDGNRILMARWNGKDKNKNTITFVCYISGSDKDNLTVHWISGNNVDIWKSKADLMYNTYDANGNKQQ